MPFSSECSYRLYIKGATEILTKSCRWHVVVHQQGGPADHGDVELAEIGDLSEGENHEDNHFLRESDPACLLVSFIRVDESLHSFSSAWTPRCHTPQGPIYEYAYRLPPCFFDDMREGVQVRREYPID